MKTLNRLLLGCILSASLASTAYSLDFDYADFSSVSGLQLNGDAAQAGDVLRITPSDINQAGSVFFDSAVPLSNLASFSTYFTFEMSSPGGASDRDGAGADGMVFVVQSGAATSLGNPGGAMGYDGLAANSLGVELDMWDNQPDNGWDNNDGNHVAVDINGDVTDSRGQTHVDTRLNDGHLWHAWVDYDNASTELQVRLSLIGERPADALIDLIDIDLAAILGGDFYVGFTGGTGGAYANQDVRSWTFASTYNSARVPDAGSSLALMALAITGLSLIRRKLS